MSELIEADIVIAGAGSAGCVLAARLSEDPRNKVVLLEAGGRGGGLLVRMPAGTFAMMGNARYDWAYQTEPDPSIMGRVSQWSGGRMLGGSSAINGMVYVRGQREDYDRWVAAGATGWSWTDVLPYFIRSEDFHGPPSPFHGTAGPLAVGPGAVRHPLVDEVMAAFENLGIPRLTEYCAGDQRGVYENLATIGKGVRSSTASAYLSPALRRPNLRVVTGALVERVLLESGRATGIRFLKGGATLELRARRVIVSAGTIGSPAILMRSGIGPAPHLRALGISVHADLPVGQNLQEHAGITFSKLVNVPTYNSPSGAMTLGRNFLRWLVAKQGPMASAAVQLMAGVKSSAYLSEPDVSISFLPLAINISSPRPSLHPDPGVTIGGNSMRPDSRGEIRLRDANPLSKPIIDHRLLGDARDVRRLIETGKLLARLFDTEPLRTHVVSANYPARIPVNDDEWEEFVRRSANIGYHPVGTCRMGGMGSVVDSSLAVHGIGGLQVIDASVMPVMVSGNTNAATIMIAEKAAAMMQPGPDRSPLMSTAGA